MRLKPIKTHGKGQVLMTYSAVMYGFSIQYSLQLDKL